MNHSSLLRAMLPIMVMGCALNALAATEVYQPSITVVRDDVSYDVNADGSFSKDQLIIARINDEQGITAAGQSGLEYIPSMQDIQVLEAYTTTPDGKRIDVGPEMIKTQKSVFGLYTQEDAKVKMVAFPALATGGTVTLHTRTVQNQPYFPGYFDEQQIFPRSEDIQSAQVVLRAPAALKLSIEAIDLAGGEVRSDQPGRKMWRWQINNARAQAPEENAPAEMDFSPRVVFSSFPDYPALGEAYMARARSNPGDATGSGARRPDYPWHSR